MQQANRRPSAVEFTGCWQVGYGVFLFLCGLAGYLSNPSAAQTALISGSVFGGLSAVWGVCILKGKGWSRIAAIATTALLACVFTWRSTVSWQAVANGEAKLFAASLISLMFVGSIATLMVHLVRRR